MNTAVEPAVTTVIHGFADALPEVLEHEGFRFLTSC